MNAWFSRETKCNGHLMINHPFPSNGVEDLFERQTKPYFLRQTHGCWLLYPTTSHYKPHATVDGCEILPPVDRCLIPWCIGFQHVSTMQGGAWFLPQLWNVHCTTTRLTILSRAKLLKDSASQRSLRRAMRGAPRHLLVFPQGGAPLVINEF